MKVTAASLTADKISQIKHLIFRWLHEFDDFFHWLMLNFTDEVLVFPEDAFKIIYDILNTCTHTHTYTPDPSPKWCDCEVSVIRKGICGLVQCRKCVELLPGQLSWSAGGAEMNTDEMKSAWGGTELTAPVVEPQLPPHDAAVCAVFLWNYTGERARPLTALHKLKNEKPWGLASVVWHSWLNVAENEKAAWARDSSEGGRTDAAVVLGDGLRWRQSEFRGQRNSSQRLVSLPKITPVFIPLFSLLSAADAAYVGSVTEIIAGVCVCDE